MRLMYNDQQIDVAAIGGGSDMHEYSTTEKEVGVWIDGSKVYEKTFEYSGQELEISSTSWTSTGFDGSYISKVIGAEILGPSNYQGSGLANIVNGIIQLQTTRNGTAYMKHLILRYTKTA